MLSLRSTVLGGFGIGITGTLCETLGTRIPSSTQVDETC